MKASAKNATTRARLSRPGFQTEPFTSHSFVKQALERCQLSPAAPGDEPRRNPAENTLEVYAFPAQAKTAYGEANHTFRAAVRSVANSKAIEESVKAPEAEQRRFIAAEVVSASGKLADAILHARQDRHHARQAATAMAKLENHAINVLYGYRTVFYTPCKPTSQQSSRRGRCL
jgi:hypothetical protein